MKLNYKVNVSEYGLNVLKVSHPDVETIDIDMTDFFKDQSHIATLFDSINEYIATLQPETQRRVYDVFYKLYATDYKVDFNQKEVVDKLENRIALVTDLLDYENFKVWMHEHSHRIIFPDNIISDYIYDPDMNTTKEKTYVKREYIDLIALIVFIRMLCPLYIDFYNHIKQVTPHYYYKIFMLFVRSKLYECEETQKLRTYIDVNQKTLIGATKNENLILSAGLSDDDILDSMVSEVVFNKLLTIDFFHKKCNIISFIFQTIKFKGTFASSDGLVIRAKSLEDNPAKDDISYFEDHRKTSVIPIGTVVEIQHALSDPVALAAALGMQPKDYDFAAYNNEVDNIRVYLDKRMDKAQINLLGWFLSKIINPRALYYIEYRKLVELMLFAKVMLTQEGHFYMAALLSSYKSSEPNFMSVVIRNTISKAAVKSISPYYSFINEEDKPTIVEKTVSEMGKEISNSLWVPMNCEHLARKVSIVDGFLETPGNVNELIFNYVEYVNKP